MSLTRAETLGSLVINEFVFVCFCRLCSAAAPNDSSHREQLVRETDEVTHDVAHASGPAPLTP